MKNTNYLLICVLIFSFTNCNKAKIEKKACIGGPVLIKNNDTSWIYIPNIFTPNADGTNDFFYVRGDLQSMHLIIKDGFKTLFETNSQYTAWDGTYNGKVKSGIFDYEITLKKLDGVEIKLKDLKISCVPISNDDKYVLENCSNCFFDRHFNGEKFDYSAFSGENICK